MRGSFTTSIEIDETEYDVRVRYQYDKGYAGSYYQPPEPPSVEILEIKPADKALIVPDCFYEDDALIAECLADVEAEAEEAAEWRAQSRRDQLMGGLLMIRPHTMAREIAQAEADEIANRNRALNMLANSLAGIVKLEKRGLHRFTDPAVLAEKRRRIARLDDLIRCCARAQAGDDIAARTVAAFRMEAGL